MSDLIVHYFRETLGEPKHRITEEQWLTAAAEAGMSIHIPVNFRVGDVNYSYTYKVREPTAEELAESKAAWEAIKEDRAEASAARFRTAWDEHMEGWEGGYPPPVIFGHQWPPGDDGSDMEIKDLSDFTRADIPPVVYGSMTIPVSDELLRDSQFDIAGWLEHGAPVRQMRPLTLLQRMRRRIRTERLALAEMAFTLIAGESPQELYERDRDDY